MAMPAHLAAFVESEATLAGRTSLVQVPRQGRLDGAGEVCAYAAQLDVDEEETRKRSERQPAGHACSSMMVLSSSSRMGPLAPLPQDGAATGTSQKTLALSHSLTNLRPGPSSYQCSPLCSDIRRSNCVCPYGSRYLAVLGPCQLQLGFVPKVQAHFPNAACFVEVQQISSARARQSWLYACTSARVRASREDAKSGPKRPLALQPSSQAVVDPSVRFSSGADKSGYLKSARLEMLDIAQCGHGNPIGPALAALAAWRIWQWFRLTALPSALLLLADQTAPIRCWSAPGSAMEVLDLLPSTPYAVLRRLPHVR